MRHNHKLSSCSVCSIQNRILTLFSRIHRSDIVIDHTPQKIYHIQKSPARTHVQIIFMMNTIRHKTTETDAMFLPMTKIFMRCLANFFPIEHIKTFAPDMYEHHSLSYRFFVVVVVVMIRYPSRSHLQRNISEISPA